MIGCDVKLENIKRVFGKEIILNDVNLTIKKGSFFSILGPSGCGKTTLLRIVGGFDQDFSGDILLDGESVKRKGANRREVNTVFQNYALFPHLSVYENIAFSLKLKKVDPKTILSKVTQFIELVKLKGQEHKKPDELSGGQKQRVAIARALINEPKVLLLDEPLSALDAKLRQHMLYELSQIHKKIGITFIYVTHDQAEALSVSDSIAVMHGGKVLQVDTPSRIYDKPQSAFVANFIGDVNFLDGVVENRETDFTKFYIPAIEKTITIKNTVNYSIGTKVCIGIRPEKLRIKAFDHENPKETNVLVGEIIERIYTGSTILLYVKLSKEYVMRVIIQNRISDEQYFESLLGAKIKLFWKFEKGYIFT